MKIKTITFALKKGLPDYSSVSAGIEAEVGENEDIDKAFDEIKQKVINNCSEDPSWINKDEGVKKE